jgi:spore coat polysaccharide biosynthesis protein SpsF
LSKVAIIVQARMGSSRLPGKVLLPVAGRPLLSYQIERLRRVSSVSDIVIATTTNTIDEPIVELAASEDVLCTRGSENDVLSRYFEAATLVGAPTIVRVTSDCPLIDPQLIEEAISAFQDPAQQSDYVSNMIEPTWPFGMAVEVFSAAALRQANEFATAADEREHVTPYIYWRPQTFRIRSLKMTPNLSHQRWTVDTSDDFELVSRILTTLYPKNACFNMSDVLALLSDNPTWAGINCHVVQKAIRSVGGEL